MKHTEAIAVFNTDPKLAEKIAAFGKKHTLNLSCFQEKEKFIEFINYELPEIAVYNFSDQSGTALAIVEEIKADPWLNYAGIIGICDAGDEEKINDRLRDTNLIALVKAEEFDRYFPRVMKIIKKNRQILFQRHIQKQILTDLSASLTIDNDPFDLAAYSHLVTNFLYNANYIDSDGKERVHVALMELLFNAVEHGNCAISYEEKSAWLEQNKSIFELIRFKNNDPRVRARKVLFRYSITPLSSSFLIADQGKGFDWKKRKQVQDEAASKEYMDLHGRGITMAEFYTKNLTYNEKGNEVSFSFPHHSGRASAIPRAFTMHAKLVYEDSDVVFKEDDESDCLYYIVSGKFNVFTQGKKLSTLTPEDVFLGEMSFLLNNRRSATVKAEGRGILLCVNKREFLAVMKREPYYSIFLGRLLAQRLERLNRMTVALV